MNILKNTGLNVLGVLIPALVAFPVLGIMARRLGIESFGLYTIVLGLVGYASIFDLGLARSVIRAVALNDEELVIEKIVGTALIFVTVVGVVISLLIYINSNYLSNLLASNIDSAELSLSIKIVALCIPLFLCTQVWLAALEGKAFFIDINLHRAISGMSLVLLPYLLICIKPTLGYAVLGLAIARLLSAVYAYCLMRKKSLASKIIWDKNTLIDLFKFGGWLTVSNIVSPLMTYMDRFFLAGYGMASKVAFYTAPSELVTRLLIFPIAITRVLFLKLCRDEESIKNELKLSYLLFLLFMCAVVAPMYFYAEKIMLLWMGPAYVGEASDVLKVLLIGFIFNAFAQLPFTQIQALGASKITAIIHLIEVLPYLGLLWFLVGKFGVLGAAFAWTSRVFLDFIVLMVTYKNMKKGATITMVQDIK